MRKFLFFILAAAALGVVFFVCLGAGEVSVGPRTVWDILTGRETDPQLSAIVLQIRLPRVLLAMAVGAGLAVAGAVLQGVLQNPLADPYTLGVSGGAALGVAAGTILFRNVSATYAAAFAGALIAILFVYLVASRGLFSVTVLVLGGVVLSYIFSASILLLFSIAEPDRFHSVLLWLMGDLSSATREHAIQVGAIVAAGCALLMLHHRELDVLTLGAERSGHLGIDPGRTVRRLFIIASLVTAACVAASGIVGFVGLIIPHFVRRVTGVSHARTLPAAFLAGAAFLTVADTAARTVIYPLELPVGVLTGIIGGCVFLAFLLRGRGWEFFR